jgi:hypothetical protein
MTDLEIINASKDRHKGETFIVFGSGPTLLEWQDSFCEGAIKIGCNTVFKHKPDLDYYFIKDSGFQNKSPNGYFLLKDEYDNYQPSISKFYGISRFNNQYTPFSLTDQDVKDGKAIGFDNYGKLFIEFHSVIFSCLQFAELCGASKVIVVGCDIVNNIRVGESEEHDGYKREKLLFRWEQFKLAHPDLDIEAFMPMGLKAVLNEYKPKLL